MSSTEAELVFLVDVDNTLLDNDRIQADLGERLLQVCGVAGRERYATVLEQLWQELGYRDYLGALQRLRVERPLDVELLAMASFLIDYPFAERLFPGALQVIAHLRRSAPVVVLSDGDAVFQPRKVQRSGIAAAVDGQVLIYIHKELALDDVQRRHPARHYVLIDDKLRILTAVKAAWKQRVTTVFARQGQFALDAQAMAALPPADRRIDRIADLLAHDAHELAAAPHAP
ncbi:MAG TPA: HAD family hydrolase [Rubrivivax sp.]|nr:HAD family hydrolase [Rubrivivax sp.]